jgi:protein involved in polysaccharide export with SLBB domain
MHMTALPPYVIEPSDILLLNTMNVVPKPPYHVQPLDGLVIQVTGTVKEREIWGLYPVDPSGNVNLGIGYGTVQVAGMTIEEAQDAISKHIGKILKNPTVQVSLGQSRAMQQISGIHLVRMDGTISLATYGSVYVTGMTIDQARKAVEEHLSQFILKPEISLDVYVYNTKWYYIVIDRGGNGQTINRLPITGKDTVLDALSNVGGTGFVSSDKQIWLSRPNGQDPNKFQMFPINLPAIVKGGSPGTNYQLLPGDRLFVKANPFIAANTRINQFWAPIMSEFNNMFGLTLLGTSTVGAVEGVNLQFKNAASSVITPGVGAVGVLR